MCLMLCSTGCIGALDGTHVDIKVPAVATDRYRNRKQAITTNVLACCDFDMYFTFALAGWEGSAHDCTVLRDAFQKGFKIPQGKFYLGDAGYGLSDQVLTPYRGVRYHLKEYSAGGSQPMNMRELFNLRHAQYR